jgi:hypothetical protein
MPCRPDAAVPSAREGRRRRTAKAGSISVCARFALREVATFLKRKKRAARPVPAEPSRALLSPAA